MTNSSDSQNVLNSVKERCIEYRTRCENGFIVWREWGTGNRIRPPLVLLHGGFGAWNHWVRTIPHLEPYNRVIIPDLPGCGDSGDPPQPYNATILANLLSDGLNKIVEGDAPFHLIAFSFGGVLSGLIARAQAHRILSVTLVGSPILGLTGVGPANDLAVIPPGLPMDEAAPRHKSNLQKLMFFDPNAADDLAVTIQIENMSKARLRSRGIARTSVLADSLRELPCHLNCIFGDSDTTVYPDLAANRAFVEKIHPEVEFHVISNTGHWVQFEAARKVNMLLTKFIS